MIKVAGLYMTYKFVAFAFSAIFSVIFGIGFFISDRKKRKKAQRKEKEENALKADYTIR